MFVSRVAVKVHTLFFLCLSNFSRIFTLALSPRPFCPAHALHVFIILTLNYPYPITLDSQVSMDLLILVN